MRIVSKSVGNDLFLGRSSVVLNSHEAYGIVKLAQQLQLKEIKSCRPHLISLDACIGYGIHDPNVTQNVVDTSVGYICTSLVNSRLPSREQLKERDLL
jgi:hypothetical protein